MSKIISATAPCSWGVWYPDGTPSKTPYELFLDQAAIAGYEALELGPDGYLPTDGKKLSEELSSRGLTVCAGTACYCFDQEESFASFRPRIEAMCKRLKAFGAGYIVAMDESDVGLYSEKKAGMPAEIWNLFLGKVKEMAVFTKQEYGIEVVYHPHIKSMIETEQEIERLMENTGISLCLDIGHHAYVNGNGKKGDKSVFSFIKKHKESIAYLHFKNVEEEVFAKVLAEHLDSDTAFDMDVMCDLEQGTVSYEELKRVLDEVGFSGIGVIEQDMPRASNEQAFAAARRNLEYLKRIGMVDERR